MESIEELVKNLNPMEWEKQVYGYMCEQTQRLARALLKKLDDVLMEKREDGLIVLGFRERWVLPEKDTIRASTNKAPPLSGQARKGAISPG